MIDWTGLIPLAAEELLLVVACLVVFDGARRLLRDGFTRWPALMVAAGLVLPVWEASSSLQVIRSVQRLQGQKLGAVGVYGREPEGGWEKAPLAPAERASASEAAAAIRYKFLGQRAAVLDAQGRRAPYDPPPAAQAEREQILRNEKGAEDAGVAAFDRGVRLFIGSAGFLLAGVVAGVVQRRRLGGRDASAARR